MTISDHPQQFKEHPHSQQEKLEKKCLNIQPSSPIWQSIPHFVPLASSHYSQQQLIQDLFPPRHHQHRPPNPPPPPPVSYNTAKAHSQHPQPWSAYWPTRLNSSANSATEKKPSRASTHTSAPFLNSQSATSVMPRPYSGHGIDIESSSKSSTSIAHLGLTDRRRLTSLIHSLAKMQTQQKHFSTQLANTSKHSKELEADLEQARVENMGLLDKHNDIANELQHSKTQLLLYEDRMRDLQERVAEHQKKSEEVGYTSSEQREVDSNTFRALPLTSHETGADGSRLSKIQNDLEKLVDMLPVLLETQQKNVSSQSLQGKTDIPDPIASIARSQTHFPSDSKGPTHTTPLNPSADVNLHDAGPSCKVQKTPVSEGDLDLNTGDSRVGLLSTIEYPNVSKSFTNSPNSTTSGSSIPAQEGKEQLRNSLEAILFSVLKKRTSKRVKPRNQPVASDRVILENTVSDASERNIGDSSVSAAVDVLGQVDRLLNQNPKDISLVKENKSSFSRLHRRDVPHTTATPDTPHIRGIHQRRREPRDFQKVPNRTSIVEETYDSNQRNTRMPVGLIPQDSSQSAVQTFQSSSDSISTVPIPAAVEQAKIRTTSGASSEPSLSRLNPKLTADVSVADRDSITHLPQKGSHTIPTHDPSIAPQSASGSFPQYPSSCICSCSLCTTSSSDYYSANPTASTIPTTLSSCSTAALPCPMCCGCALRQPSHPVPAPPIRHSIQTQQRRKKATPESEALPYKSSKDMHIYQPPRPISVSRVIDVTGSSGSLSFGSSLPQLQAIRQKKKPSKSNGDIIVEDASFLLSHDSSFLFANDTSMLKTLGQVVRELENCPLPQRSYVLGDRDVT
ncbi:hypothetical protein BSLG_007611 [Batrachochytrium salamandrivorans]|nr:hypothetical protein BSLG_007611 [Batrachochytrium salamandrivorans]